jgi:small subunit ribosomal protein S5
MAEVLQDSKGTLESTTIWVNRTAATVKGGKRFSFCALVAVGDRDGNVGLGYGKAPGVPAAIEKAQKEAKKKLRPVKLNRGTITHESTGRYCSSVVRLIPASPGTGVIAGATVRAVLELAGIRDCLTKSYGSNNKINLARATLEGLLGCRTREEIAELRGVTLEKSLVDEKIELGEKFAPSSGGAAEATTEKAKGPVNVMDEKARKGGKGGRGKGGRGRRREQAPAQSQPAEATEQPPAEPQAQAQAQPDGGEEKPSE